MSLEGEVRGLELERRAELEQAAGTGDVEPGDAGAAVRLDRDEALGGERTQGRPDAVAGHAVALGQLALGEPIAGSELPIEHPGPDRAREGVDG
jgi:hypothetical protein